MNAIPHRRAFLGQLARLPLLGGAVALVGQPRAVAEPVTIDLMEAYKTWLDLERRSVNWELTDHPDMVSYYGGTHADRYRQIKPLSHYVGQSGNFHTFDGSNPAAGRAAPVLSAVGCDWREA